MENTGQDSAKTTRQAKDARLLRIGEVAKLLGLQTSVLRYWESEFPTLAPQRTEKGQRLYSPENVALLRKVRTLLHEKGMTIEGARRVLEGGQPVPRAARKQDGEEAKEGTALEPVAPAEPHITKTRKKAARNELENVLEDLVTVRSLLIGQAGQAEQAGQAGQACNKKAEKGPLFLSLLTDSPPENPAAQKTEAKTGAFVSSHNAPDPEMP